ncbi:acyl-homoserine-lactone synthase [Roseovarius salinarum]|uniref:acyl-homoserine-lactone synthase n=1 Tax=Roseovarius salinarum TaxID=1981892 RepID=UPI000C33B9D6|nr:acyl-homoserine-lactone synthase [Roseovarius salinarum]
MIIVIDALNKNNHTTLLDQMFRLRARVFRDRRGWDVAVTEDGREIDDFDRLDPAYILSLDDTGTVVGCARLLQTTGPHMLSDVFHDILDGEPPLRSATVWESTRFCVDTDRLKQRSGRRGVSETTFELMIGTLEYARDAGISDIVTVIDPVMDRVLKRSGNAPYGYVGRQADMGKVPALAALLDCTDDRIHRLRDSAEIHGEVFADPATERALEDANRPGKKGIDLQQYCDEQVAAATTEKEKADALALRDLLTRNFRDGHATCDS